MTNRVYNFSAGPCTLPQSVLEEVQAELLDFQGQGASLIEVSHRGSLYEPLHHEARETALRVWNTPDDFDVLFIQGGATGQFAFVPMNLLNAKNKAAYINSGHWAKGAIADAHTVGSVYEAWNGEADNFMRMPRSHEIKLQDNTRYLHITPNETISGVRYAEFPDVGVPLVADMSSEMIAREIPWQLFDIVYGGAQKNLGPSGVAVVFIRKSILENTRIDLPRYLRYDIHQNTQSLFNTPSTFSIWVMGKVLKWVEQRGGVKAMEHAAIHRSSLIYSNIDSSDGFYTCPAAIENRSTMNVVFNLPTPELETEFHTQAAKQGMPYLRGHRVLGGIRASIYNSMPTEGVESLVNFMQAFMRKNG